MKAIRFWFTAAVVCMAGVWAVKAFGQVSEKQWSLAEIKAVSVFVRGLTEETKKAESRWRTMYITWRQDFCSRSVW